MGAKVRNAKKKVASSLRTKKNQDEESTPLPIHYGQVEKLLALMQKHALAEFEWERGDERLSLRTHHAFSGAVNAAPVAYSAPAMNVAPPVPASGSKPSKESRPANQKEIISPFVGTFYRSPSPESPPYIKEGQQVKAGEVLCIVEAMKLMNEIEAEFPCKIVSVLIENGQPVEYGEPLFVVETL